jgi:uncharacterized membrane protein
VHPLDVLTLVCALGTGLIAGVFFIFSICVMKALRALPAACGMAAMQSINIVIINPWFLSVFLGTAGSCVLATALSIVMWNAAGAGGRLVGSALYLIGVLFVTMRFNVPLNDALERVAPGSSDAASLWADYLSRWTAWNHVRTVAALLAALSFALTRLTGF